MKKFIKQLGAFALAAAAFAPAFTPVHAQGEFEGETVKVGVVGEAEGEVWEFVKEQAKEQEGIDIEVVLFTDYVQPNVALKDGSIDLNAFQHIAFLDEWNESNDGDLTPLGFTYVTPLGVYSEKVTSLDELTDGATIAIPNNPVNTGRALLALELAGLIEVDDAAGILPTVNDVTSNELNLKFEELETGQLAQSLPDVDAAIINNTFALDAGLTVEDAIFLDAAKPEDLKDVYKNVVASTKENADNPLYLKIVELYQTDAVADKIAEVSNGGDVPAWTEDGAKTTESSEESTDESEESSAE